MTDDLPHRLSTWDGRRAVGDEVARRIRAQDFVGAENYLVERLMAYPGQIATAARGLTEDQVRVDGWDELDDDLDQLGRRGHAVTAIELALSNYSDSNGVAWWDKEPVVEFAAFTDEVFPFSTTKRQYLLEHNERYPAPWTGGMLGEETVILHVTGLRGLNGALLRHQSEHPWSPKHRGTVQQESVAEFLGWWWLHLRFQQAVVRDLDERGLALPVPVLIGTHDVGPWLQSVHRATRACGQVAAPYDAHAAETVPVRELPGRLGWFGREKRRLRPGGARS